MPNLHCEHFTQDSQTLPVNLTDAKANRRKAWKLVTPKW